MPTQGQFEDLYECIEQAIKSAEDVVTMADTLEIDDRSLVQEAIAKMKDFRDTTVADLEIEDGDSKSESDSE